jgi:hypothetical protein
MRTLLILAAIVILVLLLLPVLRGRGRRRL